MNRGDVYSIDWPGAGVHPAVVVTRQSAIPFLTNVTVVLVTSTVRDLPTEVPLGAVEGLEEECVANCDNVLTVPKAELGDYRGRLAPDRLEQLNDALPIALELD